MLVIHNIETIDKSKLKVTKRKSKKSQIFLFDTQRRIDDYVNMIKHRRNGNYDDIPHYIISKLGLVYEIFDPNHTSNTFNDPKFDRKLIKVAIENLGWLNKNTITGVLNNWIGDPYRAEPFIRTWRGRHFWDKYNDSQMDALSELCSDLCNKHDITKQTVPSQGYLENIYNFKGIVCKSNFSNIYTDINPSFNFRIFFNNAKETNQ
jgi:hypothetical protein